MIIARSKNIKTLVEMDKGQTGRVVRLRGGCHFKNRLEALGIRPGKEITKISSMFLQGPITVKIGNAKVAIGYGMAGKIEVEVNDNEDTSYGQS